MKLYSSRQGSNPKRVRIFLAEKNVQLPTVDLDFMKDEQRAPEFLEVNSLGKAPVLVLDDGTIITESVAICRFVEEVHPEPVLFGADRKSRALIEMWIRRAELELVRPCADVVQHSIEFFADNVEQVPDFAAAQRRNAVKKFTWLNEEMGSKPFLAGNEFSMADIVAITAVDLAGMMKIEIPEYLENLNAWIGRITSRESYTAS